MQNYYHTDQTKRENLFRKHNIALNHILKGELVTLDIMRKILEFPYPAEICQEHLELCAKIYNHPIRVPLPIPNTDNVAEFSKIAGPERVSKTKNEVSGCYYIFGLDLKDSYVGQAKHLGYRVKSHIKGKKSSVKDIFNILGKRGFVNLYIVSKDTYIPKGLTFFQFITVLEQYLFFNIKPSLNKLYVAQPGIVWSPETILKHSLKVGKPFYVYKKDREGHMHLIFKLSSRDRLGILLGFERTWAKNILNRTKGWFKDTLFFSFKPIKGSSVSLISLEELRKLVSELILNNPRNSGLKVKITNSKTGEILYYNSIKSAANSLKADESSISVRLKNKDKSSLFRNIYRIEPLTYEDFS